MNPRDWGPGDWLKAGAALVVLAGIVWGGKIAIEHPPEANPRLDALEAFRQEMHEHEAHDDSITRFNLCREAETALEVPERVAVARCLQEYPTLLDIVELAPAFRAIEAQASRDTTP